MNHHAWDPACKRSDAVLAMHLDGDVEASGFEFVCGETLNEHLRDCATCQHLLQRARRLDAVLAADAGRWLAEAGDDACARWFAAVAPPPAAAKAAPAPEITASEITVASGGRSFATVAAGACVAVAALLAALLVAPRTAPAGPLAPVLTRLTRLTSVPVPPVSAAPCPNLAATAAAPAFPEIVVAADAPQHGGQRRALEAGLTGQTGQTGLTGQTGQTGQPALLTLVELQRRVGDGKTSAAERLAAARGLLVAAQPLAADARTAASAFVDCLAALGDASPAERLVHGDLLVLAHDTPWLIAYLQARLTRLRGPAPALRDLAVFTVASRLGAADLDQALRRAVRSDPGLAPLLASALRCGLREQGTAALLLDAWHDLSVRGTLGDDAAAAWLWFGGQGATVFDELMQELRVARAEPRRLRCLLALGCCPDGRTLPLLLEHTKSRRHGEAHAASFAIASLPRRCLRPLSALANNDDSQHLLRAALARAAVPEARPWLDVLALTAAERQLLTDATLTQFPEVIGWFRNRATAASD